MATGQFINGVFVSDERAIACVNALAGVKDPEEFMRDVRLLTVEINAQDDDDYGRGAAALTAIHKHLGRDLNQERTEFERMLARQPEADRKYTKGKLHMKGSDQDG